MSDGNLECVNEQVLVTPFQSLRAYVFPFKVFIHLGGLGGASEEYTRACSRVDPTHAFTL